MPLLHPIIEGLGEPSGKELHPFLNLKSAAYSITDAVVAASKLLGNQAAETRWSVVGHSQGGHAALGAAQYASRAQLNYKGAIAIAPASNLALVLAGGRTKSSSGARCNKQKYIHLVPLDTLYCSDYWGSKK